MAIGIAPPKIIRDYVGYNPVDGTFIRFNSSGGARAGDRADHPIARGYRRVHFRNKSYLAHRLAWFLHFNEWPPCLVDHINGDKGDNRICNLRLADFAQNTANRRYAGRIMKGVTLHKQTGKYQSQIKSYGRSYYLGLFDTPALAHAAYAEAAARLHGEFARTA